MSSTLNNRLLKHQSLVDGIRGGNEAITVISSLRVARHDVLLAAFRESFPEFYTPVEGDVSSTIILQALNARFNNSITVTATNKTPDSFMIDHALKIVDVKVRADVEGAAQTIHTYEDAFAPLAAIFGIPLEVTVINYNPRRSNISIMPYTDFYNRLELTDENIIEIDSLTELIDNLIQTWQNDRIFQAREYEGIEMLGDMTKKSAEHWRNNTVELDGYSDFTDKMSVDDLQIFTKLMRNDFSDEPDLIKHYWDKVKILSEEPVEPSTLKRATESELTEAFNIAEARMINTSSPQLTPKPSVHFLSTTHLGLDVGDNISRIDYFSNVLKTVKSSEPIIRLIKSLKMTPEQKVTLHASKKVDLEHVAFVDKQTVKIKDIPLRNELFENAYVNKGYTKRKLRLQEQVPIVLEKPMCLDLESPMLVDSALHEMDISFEHLSEEVIHNNNAVGKYLLKDMDVNDDTHDFLLQANKTHAATWLDNQKTCLSNMMALSGVTKSNTVTFVTGKSDTSLYIMYPSKKITGERTTICYQSVHLVLPGDDQVHTGTVLNRIKAGCFELIITKPVRLDKQRINTLISAHERFYIVATQLYLATKGDPLSNALNSLDVFQQIIGHSFYMSQQITLSYTGVVDKFKYIVQDVIANNSNILEFLNVKFNPRIKNLYTLYMYTRFKESIGQLNKQFAEAKRAEVLVEYESIISQGFESFDVPSLFVKSCRITDVRHLIQEYTLPWYNTSKDLHQSLNSLIKLYSVPLEYEEKYRTLKIDYKKDFENKFFMSSIMAHQEGKTKSLLRARNSCFTQDHIDDSVTLIRTMTSTKACVKISNKAKSDKTVINMCKADPNIRLKNEFMYDLRSGDLVERKTGKVSIRCIRTDYWVNSQTSKVFDELYIKADNPDKYGTIVDWTDNCSEWEPVCSIFPKNQRTAEDREIYMMDINTKAHLYLIESFYRQQCKSHVREVITKPGDEKTRSFIGMKVKAYKERYEHKTKPIFAHTSDMSLDCTKWSAQDLVDKYILLISTSKVLKPAEKWKLVHILCKYKTKKLVLKDTLIEELLNMNLPESNIFMHMTDKLKFNYVYITQNWFQGNFNYMSSLVHAHSHDTMEDVLHFKETPGNLPKPIFHSLVHSDDSVLTYTEYYEQPPNRDEQDRRIYSILTKIGKLYSITYNDKKSFISTDFIEFISKILVNGEYVSNYMRDLLPAVAEIQYKSPAEDLMSAIGPLNQAVASGAPIVLTKLTRNLVTYLIREVYALLPGMANSLQSIVFENSVDNLPTMLLGNLGSNDYDTVLHGSSGPDIRRMIEILQKFPKDLNLEKWIENMSADLLSPKDLEFLRILYFSRRLSLLSDNTVTIGYKENFFTSVLIKMSNRQASLAKKYHSGKEYTLLATEGLLKTKLTVALSLNPQWIIMKPNKLAQYKDYIFTKLCNYTFRGSLQEGKAESNLAYRILSRNGKCVPANFLQASDSLFDPTLNQGFKVPEQVTLREALQMVKLKIDSITMSDQTLKMLFKHIFTLNKHTKNLILIDLYKTTNGMVEVKSKVLNFMSDITSMSLVINPPAKVILKAILPEIYESEQITVGVERSLVSDVSIIKTMVKEMKLERYLIAPMGGDLLTLEAYVTNLGKIILFLFDFLTMKIRSKQGFVMPVKTRIGLDFAMSLIGSREKDDYYNRYVIVNKQVKEQIFILHNRPNTDISEVLLEIRALIVGLSRLVNKAYVGMILREFLDNSVYLGKSVKDILLEGLKHYNTQSQCASLLYEVNAISYEVLVEKTQRESLRAEWLLAQRTPSDPFLVNYHMGDLILIIQSDGKVITRIALNIPKSNYETEYTYNRAHLKKMLSRARSDIPNLYNMKYPSVPSSRITNYTWVENGRIRVSDYQTYGALPFKVVKSGLELIVIPEDRYKEQIDVQNEIENSFVTWIPVIASNGRLLKSDLRYSAMDNFKTLTYRGTVVYNNIRLFDMLRDETLHLALKNETTDLNLLHLSKYVALHSYNVPIRFNNEYLSIQSQHANVGILTENIQIVKSYTSKWNLLQKIISQWAEFLTNMGGTEKYDNLNDFLNYVSNTERLNSPDIYNFMEGLGIMTIRSTTQTQYGEASVSNAIRYLKSWTDKLYELKSKGNIYKELWVNCTIASVYIQSKDVQESYSLFPEEKTLSQLLSLGATLRWDGLTNISDYDGADEFSLTMADTESS